MYDLWRNQRLFVTERKKVWTGVVKARLSNHMLSWTYE